MEIKEACEYVKSNGGFYGSLRLGTKGNKAYKTIEKALCDDYTLCKVDEAIKRIKQRAWKENIIEVEDCVKIIKEACL